jgi:hypothetical protein
MTARENRDTVFCQMRRAMDLIHYVVKDGVLDCAAQVSAAAAAANSVDPLGSFQDPQTAAEIAHRSAEVCKTKLLYAFTTISFSLNFFYNFSFDFKF